MDQLAFLAQLAQRLISEYGEDRNSQWVLGLITTDLATKEGRDFLLLLSGYLVQTHGVSIYSPLVLQLNSLAKGVSAARSKAGISRRKIGRFGQSVKTIGRSGT